jgi:Flp pilus assembly protein TadD/TolB-like protein
LGGLCYNTVTMPSPWFRIGLLAICAVLYAAAGARPALAGQAGAGSRVSVAESHPLTILVFPFENRSHIANLNWLGEGLSELTVERLRDRGASVLARQDRLATVEKMGLPDSARFSHATLVKIAGEADADVVIYGRFVSDGKTVTLEARVLHISPPSLSPPLTETSPMAELLRAHARLTWQIICSMNQARCPAAVASRDETSFSDPPPSLRLDALENLSRGLTESDDDDRIRLLREASRLEPAWDRPPFELGLIYFERRDCESALPWFSRVPPDRPNGPEASFDAGVCHLLRNDAARADAAFSVLIERTRSTDPREKLPNFPEVHNNMGIALLLEGKWSEAATEFERAAALDPGEPDYLVNLGIAKLAGKQPAAAVAPLEDARKLNPDDKDARALLIPLLESLGRSSEAAALRAETPENVGRAKPLIPQNVAALVPLARPSKKFDRSLLRPAIDPPAAQHAPGNTPARIENKGETR